MEHWISPVIRCKVVQDGADVLLPELGQGDDEGQEVDSHRLVEDVGGLVNLGVIDCNVDVANGNSPFWLFNLEYMLMYIVYINNSYNISVSIM